MSRLKWSEYCFHGELLIFLIFNGELVMIFNFNGELVIVFISNGELVILNGELVILIDNSSLSLSLKHIC